jgi:hypothetical protein
MDGWIGLRRRVLLVFYLDRINDCNINDSGCALFVVRGVFLGDGMSLKDYKGLPRHFLKGDKTFW